MANTVGSLKVINKYWQKKWVKIKKIFIFNKKTKSSYYWFNSWRWYTSDRKKEYKCEFKNRTRFRSKRICLMEIQYFKAMGFYKTES
jgi:hypothetical protein